MDKKIKNEPIYKIKIPLWSHLLMIIGYIVLFITLIIVCLDGSCEFFLLYYLTTAIITSIIFFIPLLLVFFMEKYEKNLNISHYYKNKLYIIIWIIGQLIIIFALLIQLYYFILPIFNKLYYLLIFYANK